VECGININWLDSEHYLAIKEEKKAEMVATSTYIRVSQSQEELCPGGYEEQ
jgi:hypothetical protein